MEELADFEVLNYLGEGSYGRVFQARKKNGDDVDKIYALKSVPKKYKGNSREKSILSRIKHPMVVELFYTFETEKKLYFVLEYLCGGTLSAVLDDHDGSLSEQDASFYVKEGIVALEYLHSQGIIYRDLKQTNILLDINGHIKLIDFGLSEENFTPNTLSFVSCGTPYYKAPEILKKTGHGFAVDWWSLGILFYRMVAGKYPFGGNEPKKVGKAILAGKYTLPENLSTNAKHLLTQLLQANPKKRLGYTNGATAIKKHPFFENTSWENVSQRVETPPFVPSVENANDVSRFPILLKYFSTSLTTTSSSSEAERVSSVSNNLSADVSPQKKIKLESKSSNESSSSTTAQPTTASPETAPPQTQPKTTAPPKI